MTVGFRAILLRNVLILFSAIQVLRNALNFQKNRDFRPEIVSKTVFYPPF